MKRNWIVSIILLVLMVTTICLKSVWNGFIYFSISFLILLSLYWLITLIVYYVEDYYFSFDEDFKEYKAELINSTNVTSEQFEENLNLYIKDYKKSIRKFKVIDIFKILFLLVVIILCILAMAKGNLNF